MFKVYFPEYAVINEDELPDLLRVVGTLHSLQRVEGADMPAPVSTGKKRGRKPKVATSDVVTESPNETAIVPSVGPDPAPDYVPDPVKPVATTSGPAAASGKGGGKSSSAKAPGSKAAAPETTELLSRFSELINTNYDGAVDLLQKFGISRFSDLKPTEYANFSTQLEEFGV